MFGGGKGVKDRGKSFEHPTGGLTLSGRRKSCLERPSSDKGNKRALGKLLIKKNLGKDS